MQVIEATPLRLKLRHRPIRSWLSGGFALVVSGWVLIYLFGLRPTFMSVQCDRPNATQTTCTLTQRAALWWPLQQRKLFEPKSASVAVRRSSKGHPSYSVAVVTPYDTVILLPNSPAASSEAIVAQFNQYIQNPQLRVLRLQQNSAGSTLWALIFVAAGLGFGLWFILTPTLLCAFYKRIDKVTIERRRWLGRPETKEYPLHSVIQVEVEERQSKYGNLYRPVLVLTVAASVPLSSDWINEAAARKTQTLIQSFLTER